MGSNMQERDVCDYRGFGGRMDISKTRYTFNFCAKATHELRAAALRAAQLAMLAYWRCVCFVCVLGGGGVLEERGCAGGRDVLEEGVRLEEEVC